jgi:anti-sigma regulatory factor (Ser/Thr protein kinase)
VAPLNQETLRSDTTWFPINDASASGSARRAAIKLAGRLGFNEARRGDVGIVASEVSSNLFRHAREGSVAVQVALRHGSPGVQIVAVDHGPGMADFSAFSVDGRSTTDTLGVGLGAVARLSTSLDVSSQPGLGTVMVAGLWSEAPEVGSADVGGITRPIANEEPCGDAVAGRETNAHQVVLVADGLGHGPLASAASQQAVDAFFDIDDTEPRAVLSRLHDRLNHTRGAAAMVLTVDPSFRRLQVAGIGNISAFVVGRESRRALVTFPGIVGHQTITIRQIEYDIDDESIVVMHSDGVKDSWDLAAVPGLSRRSAPVIAASVLRDAGSRRDDASVLVIRRPR